MSELHGDNAKLTASQKPTHQSGFLRTRLSISIWRLAIIALMLACWEFVVRAGLINRFFLAGPSDVVIACIQLGRSGELWIHVFTTVWEMMLGFIIGSLVGAAAGFALGLSERATTLMTPLITMFNSLPRIALAPLFVLWFGIGVISHATLVFSVVVFIVLTNALAGTRSVDRDYVTLARVLGATRLEVIFKVIFPSTLPWIFAAMHLSIAYALGAAVVGEMFLGQAGLGYLIQAGSGLFNIAQIFAAIACSVAVAYFVDSLLSFVERHALKWRSIET